MTLTPKVATLALPTREAYVTASVWPGAGGVLLMTAELNLTPQARQELTSALLAKLEHRWTELSRTGKEMPTDGVLEQVLIEANTALKLYERLLGNPLAPRYHLSLAFLRGADISAAAVGHCGVYVANEEQFSNVIQPDGNNRRPAKPTFEHVMSGRLAAGEILLLATPALLDYFSVDKLQQLMASNPPGYSLREVEKFMVGLKVHPPLGIVCLKAEPSQIEGIGTDGSIQHLMDTRTATSQLLRPSLWRYLRSRFRRSPEPQPTVRTVDEVAEAPAEPRPSARQPDRSGRRGATLARLNRSLTRLKWLTDRETAKMTVARWLEFKLIAWRRLSLAKRLTLLLALVLLVAFCQSIVQLGRRSVMERQSERYNEVVTHITERQAAAESALIYQDDERARQLLDEAYGLLATLPKSSKQREQQWNTLSQTLDLTRQRLERKVVVNDMSPWIELPALPEGSTWSNLAIGAGAVLVADSDGRILSIGQTGETKELGKLADALGRPERMITLGDATLVMASDGQALVTDSVQTVQSPLPAKDAAWYDGRVYYLDQNGSSIYRTTRQGSGFAAASPWLRSNQTLPQGAASLAVDGAIYVAGPAEVRRYLRGAAQEFGLQPLDPPLRSAAMVRTSAESDQVYVWEPGTKRLSAFDKQGKLLVQILFTNSDILDMTVDDIRKEAYVLTSAFIARLSILQ